MKLPMEKRTLQSNLNSHSSDDAITSDSFWHDSGTWSSSSERTTRVRLRPKVVWWLLADLDKLAAKAFSEFIDVPGFVTWVVYRWDDFLADFLIDTKVSSSFSGSEMETDPDVSELIILGEKFPSCSNCGGWLSPSVSVSSQISVVLFRSSNCDCFSFSLSIASCNFLQFSAFYQNRKQYGLLLSMCSLALHYSMPMKPNMTLTETSKV